MSDIDRSITNGEVIPVFETDMFDGQEGSRFAIGIIAVGDEVTPGCEDAFDAYLRLRAKVYADQTRMISKDQVREDGTEMDADDSRSVHFGVFEQHELGARAVGSIRLIIKDEKDDRPLPIEDFFGIEAPMGSDEASRLIARHEQAVVQGGIKWALFTGALAYVRAHNLGPTYATVEEGVERDFARCRMKTERVADPKYVEEYQADNLGVVIDTEDFAVVVDRVQPGMLEQLTTNEGAFTFYGRQPSRPVTPPPAPATDITANLMPLAAAA
jgi:N-acyl-L-homoserine lactone synthetase